MKKRTPMLFLTPFFTRNFYGFKPLLLLLFFSGIAIFANGQDFNVFVSPPTGTDVVPYCEIIEFELEVRNSSTGAAEAFEVLIAFHKNDFDIQPDGNIPNPTISYPGDYVNITFTTSVIPSNSSNFYKYYLIATGFGDNDRELNHNVERPSTEVEVVKTVYLDFIPETESTTQYNNYVRVSDLIDDLENSSGANFTILPDEAYGGYAAACDPMAPSQYLNVPEKLIVDIDDYCINNGTIVMGSGAEIIVEDGSVLNMKNQKIYSCQKMWKGIHVKSGGALVLDNCDIINAQYGIRADRGAKIFSNETFFQDCYVGMYVSPFSYAQDPENPGNTYVNIVGFSGNQFFGTGELLPPYSGQSPTPLGDLPYAGIEVNNLSSFVLPGNADDFTANIFEDLSNGIIARNTSLSVGDAFFKDIEYDSELALKTQGYGIYIENGKYSKIIGNNDGQMASYSYHFDNVYQGIFNSKGAITVYGMTMNDVTGGIFLQDVTNRPIYIEENNITGFNKGILLDLCMPTSSLINYNVINISSTKYANGGSCIEMNDYAGPTIWVIEFNDLTIGDAKYAILNRSGFETTIMNNTITVEYYDEDEGNGIYLDGTNRALVTCNDISGDNDDPNFHDSRGIHFDGSDSYDISCNNIIDFRYGIFASSMNKGQLKGNDIKDQYYGLYISESTAIGIQDHKGNKWSGIYKEKAAVNKNFNNLAASRFNVDSSDDPQYSPDVTPSTGWFIDEDGDSFTCIDSMICLEGSGWYSAAPYWDSLDIVLVEGNLGFDNFDDPLSWNGRFDVYRRLKYDTVPSLPITLSNFLSTQQDSNIGKFSNAYDSLFYAIKYHGPQESVLEEYPSHLSRIFDDVVYLDSLILTDRYNNDSLTTLMVARYDSIFHYEYHYLQKDSIINVVLTANIENAIDYIEDIDPDSSWQEKLQFTLLEYLNLAKTDTLLSSSDLYELANTCPDKYGDPVYHARSLIRRDSVKNHYDNQDLCNYINPRSTKTQVNLGKLYPNPANSKVYIEAEHAIAQLQVITVAGKPVHANSQIQGSNAIINVSTLPSGIYYVRSFSRSGKMEFYKLIIARK